MFIYKIFYMYLISLNLHLSLNFFHYHSYQPSEKSLLLLHLQSVCVYCLKNIINIYFRYITPTQ